MGTIKTETIEITKLAFGGDAVGHLASGKVVFVSGGTPGDVLKARVVREKRSFATAVIDTVIHPSPHRVDPVCAAADRCGGCPWMHIDYEVQLQWKQRLLEAELERAALGSHTIRVEHGAALGGRTRTRMHIKKGRFGTMGRSSAWVAPFAGCPILAPPVEEFAWEVADYSSTNALPDADLELYVDARGSRGLFVRPKGQTRKSTWAAMAAPLGIVSLRVGDGQAHGPPLVERSWTRTVVFDPGVFVQAHRAMNQTLVERAVLAAGQGLSFVEIYAGAGNLTVHLAQRFSKGFASEADARAVHKLRANLGDEDTSNTQVCCENDGQSALRLLTAERADVLVADPPRAGMQPLLPLFRSRPPRRAVLISCHPMAAMRDLRELAKVGYSIKTVEAFDMFPNTDHVELLAVVER